MYLDVVDLKRFYYRTQLGKVAQSRIQEAITKQWPDVAGLTVAGFGFAVPFLRPFLGADRIISMMPGQQGVMPWPFGAPNISLLVDEFRWPISTGVLDRIIIAHAVETTDSPQTLLEEVYRCLSAEGEVAFVIANRMGFWSSSEDSPFGYGRPYSLGQFEAQLTEAGFMIEHEDAVLYLPPSQRRFWLRSAGFWENIGRKLGISFPAGVLVVIAKKRVFAPKSPNIRRKATDSFLGLEGITRPRPEPISGRSRRIHES